MRFRLTTKPPLTSLKAWFDIADNDVGLSVLGLKAQICSRVRQLSGDYATELNLSIDDFDLLDDSSAHVIKENDLVCISRKRDSTNQKKRKASDTRDLLRKKRKTSEDIPSKRCPSPTSEEHKSSSSSSLSEASSSSDAFSSESESESDTDSDTTSSESTVEVLSSKKAQREKLSVNEGNKPHIVHPIPPGNGKQSTYNRNARRRVKRLYARQQAQVERLASQALSSGSINAIPLSIRAFQVQVQAGDPNPSEVASPASITRPVLPTKESFYAERMSTTLRNKNKKKGFKRAMTGVAAQKIVFGDENNDSLMSATSTYPFATPTTPKAQVPRLITPSEKQAQGLLPSNLFVTSIEVESKKWDRKEEKRDLYGYDDDEIFAEQTGGNDEMVLEYGEADADTRPIRSSKLSIDWASVEQKWDGLTAVTDISSLGVGVIVGWTALAIDPATFTPEMLVHLGRIKEVRLSTSAVVLVHLRRPGEEQIAFGALGTEDEHGAEDGKPVEEEETYLFEDALKMSWKLVEQRSL